MTEFMERARIREAQIRKGVHDIVLEMLDSLDKQGHRQIGCFVRKMETFISAEIAMVEDHHASTILRRLDKQQELLEMIMLEVGTCQCEIPVDAETAKYCQCEEPRDCETAKVCQACGKPLKGVKDA